MGVFVIAEAGSSWVTPEGAFDVTAAARLIDAAAECGANAIKFQFTSNAAAMAERRGLGPEAAAMYKKYLQWSPSLLEAFRAQAERVRLELMCTVFLPEDLHLISPLVSRFKISAFESGWADFVYAHKDLGRPVIISKNPGKQLPDNTYWADVLHCVSEYPTPLERLGLRNGMQESNCVDGLSDHTTSTLTGALAVAAGATIVEKHIRLNDTDKGNPDYGHSLCCVDDMRAVGDVSLHQFNTFKQYVSNIREAEKAL